MMWRYLNYAFAFTWSAPKVMPPIFSHWPNTSNPDVDGMVVEVEPSHQYFIIFWFCMTGGSRGAVQQNDVWCGSTDEAKMGNWISPHRKNASTDVRQCLLNVSGDQTVDVSTVRWSVVCSSSGDSSTGLPSLAQIFLFFNECCIRALVHHWWKYRANGGDYVEK